LIYLTLCTKDNRYGRYEGYSDLGMSIFNKSITIYNFFLMFKCYKHYILYISNITLYSCKIVSKNNYPHYTQYLNN